MLSCAACGGAPPHDPDQKRTFPARGKVLFDGQPLRRAVVTLYPLQADSKSVRSYGRTDAEGNVEFSTYQPGDGVPAGRYAVVILPDADEGGIRVPGRYANPKTSGLIVEVKEQENTLPVFRLHR